ncbi:hypothetical protein OTU49_007818 [Cherax quadricarinatus]|uniref:Phosphatidylethanolamine-binding protein n=2 Tax=Cherax quadricarinatus TaxID=27406 RepID=A0AAW0WV55_CHEQU
MLARIVSFMLRAVVVVTVFTLGPVLTTQCDLQPPIYECSQLPPLVVEYDNVTLNTCGGLFDKQLFVKQGAVTYTQGDATKTYTVVMVDPDAPRHTEGESYLHWLHSGLQGSDLVNGVITTGYTLMDYAPPTPPAGTGVHRYLFYLYQDTVEKDTELQAITKRGKFKLYEYTKQNALCGPVAQTMFSTHY